MSISSAVKREVVWWRDNIYTIYRSLEVISVADTIHTGASSHGWEITRINKDQKIRINKCAMDRKWTATDY